MQYDEVNDRDMPSEVLTENSKGRNQANQRLSSYGKPKGVNDAFKQFAQSLNQNDQAYLHQYDHLVVGHTKSIKVLREQKDEIREHTMRRIESMGLKAPIAWRDELYKNELTKLDLRSALESQAHLKTDSKLAELTKIDYKFFDR